MPIDDNEWKWIEFVKIGNTINKMSKVLRIEKAKAALNFSNDLLLTKYITNSQERYEIYDQLISKIAEYLDGDKDIIQSTVETHFFMQHCVAGYQRLDFSITYLPKRSGIQSGFICDVSNSVDKTTRYYIKTHQHGPTPEIIKSTKLPDCKEFFIYKLLQSLGMGPEVEFIIPIHGTKRTIYIATRDAQLTLLSELTPDTVCDKSLLQIDLISRILCLSDMHYSNFGQVGNKPMIIDFGIKSESYSYAREDVLPRFMDGTGQYNWTGLMKLAHSIPTDEKLAILKESLSGWNIIENIDETHASINKLIESVGGLIKFENDLEHYVNGIKETIEFLKNTDSNQTQSA